MCVLGQLWAALPLLARGGKKRNEKPKEWDGCTLKSEIKKEITVIIYNINNNVVLESCQCPHSPLYFVDTYILGSELVLFHLNFTQPTFLHVN